jgi:hypothetical protein
MDEHWAAHKAAFAPTLRHINRTVYPCRRCMRNTMEEYLCAACLEAVRVRIPNAYSRGAYVYLPVECSIESTIEYLRWELALDHLAFDWCVAKYPIIPADPPVFVTSPLLVFRPFRRTSVEHFFFRAPNATTGLPQPTQLPKTLYLLQNSELNRLPVSHQATS